MSMREEDRADRQKNNNCPSRGLGLAAAALGVGVGAALYYFLSKKPENPDGEGSTTGWTCEQPHAFNESNTSMENYSLVFSVSDTSMENNSNYSNTSLEDSHITIYETTTTDTSINSDPESEEPYIVSSDLEDSSSLSEDLDWEVTDSSLDVPSEEQRTVSPVRMMIGRFGALFSPRPSERRRRHRTSEEERRDILRAQALSEEEHIKLLKTQRFRERSWSLEECSICFEIMLKDQQLTSLPCSHNFHSVCLAPWLEEQQTCPNCRKAAE